MHPADEYTRRIIEDILIRNNVCAERKDMCKAVRKIARNIGSTRLSTQVNRYQPRKERITEQNLEPLEIVTSTPPSAYDNNTVSENVQHEIQDLSLQHILPEEPQYTDPFAKLRTYLTRKSNEETIIFTPQLVSNGTTTFTLEERMATSEECQELNRCYDWDKKNDTKLILLLPQNDKECSNNLLTSVTNLYENYITTSLSFILPVLSRLFHAITHSYEIYQTALTDPFFALMYYDSNIRNIYRHTIICILAKNGSIDTTQPAEYVTVEPLCLDTLLDTLTHAWNSHEFAELEKTLYNQTIRHITLRQNFKPKTYLRTYHTANHGLVLSEDNPLFDSRAMSTHELCSGDFEKENKPTGNLYNN